MTTEFTGGGDPKRSIELLWGLQEPKRRGPKPRLQVAEIVRAAIAIADGEGIAALSMRRVADTLGVAPMTLYSYVPAKAELLDLMLDAVLGETPRPPIADWRTGLAAIARSNWDLYHRHPWMLHIAAYRPPLGPNLIAKYEYELSAVEGIGLADLDMDHVVALVGAYVAAAARGSVEAAMAERETGISDVDWWAANAPVLEQVLDASQFPIASRVGSASGAEYEAPSSPDTAFAFGLERILDGIEVLVSRRSG